VVNRQGASGHRGDDRLSGGGLSGWCLGPGLENDDKVEPFAVGAGGRGELFIIDSSHKSFRLGSGRTKGRQRLIPAGRGLELDGVQFDRLGIGAHYRIIDASANEIDR
jgi:hypothetical protein